jgi:hypothetical protein
LGAAPRKSFAESAADLACRSRHENYHARSVATVPSLGTRSLATMRSMVFVGFRHGGGVPVAARDGERPVLPIRRFLRQFCQAHSRHGLGNASRDGKR